MKKKLFVVSDVHGHYTEMIDALDRSGFQTENEGHVFLSCGDLFDRGNENLQVYDFVRSLPRKILIKGNHEDMLLNALKLGKITDLEQRNGTDVTITQLLGQGAVDANGYFDTSKYAFRIGEIIEFIQAMSDFYETQHYVFVHGWLPVTVVGKSPYINQSWRTDSLSEWENARWLEWQQLYSVGATLEGKTIVCGHRPARLGYMFDSLREPDCSEPFYGDGMIAMDAGTVNSGRVNVLEFENV